MKMSASERISIKNCMNYDQISVVLMKIIFE